MTELDPRDDRASRAARRRHRQSAAALSMSTGLAALRQSPRRGLLIGGGVVVLVVLLVLGYAIWNSHQATLGNPPMTVPSDQPAPSGGSRPPVDESSAPSASASPSRTTKPPNDDKTTPPDKRPAPRLVGPKDLDGFTKLLGKFCEDRGDRTAVLLDGPNSNRTTGNWACVRIVTFTEINLDEACRKSFGEQAAARQLKRRDSRTWRCFDS